MSRMKRMKEMSSESDENDSSETHTSTPNISPSLGNFSKDIADLCGILISEIRVLSIDKSLDSNNDHLQQLEDAIIHLGDDNFILKSLETARNKLLKKQTYVEDEQKKLNESDTTTPLPDQSKRKKFAGEYVRSPPLSQLKTIPKIIHSLIKFTSLFEVKVSYLIVRQPLRKEDINVMHQQEIYTNQSIEHLRDARVELKTIVARMKGQSASTDSN